jgi:hypothetical protein
MSTSNGNGAAAEAEAEIPLNRADEVKDVSNISAFNSWDFMPISDSDITTCFH